LLQQIALAHRNRAVVATAHRSCTTGTSIRRAAFAASSRAAAPRRFGRREDGIRCASRCHDDGESHNNEERAPHAPAIIADRSRSQSIAKSNFPPISARKELKLDGGPKPVLDNWKEEKRNSTVELLEHVPGFRRDVQLPAFDHGEFHSCAPIVRKQLDAAEHGYKLDDCDKATYLVLLRYSQRVEAKVMPGNKYVPGRCIGDALIFDLKSGKQVGVVPLNGTNSDEVTQHMQQARPEFYLKLDLDRSCSWSAQLVIDELYGKASSARSAQRR
jgi:hypothetical protein